MSDKKLQRLGRRGCIHVPRSCTTRGQGIYYDLCTSAACSAKLAILGKTDGLNPPLESNSFRAVLYATEHASKLLHNPYHRGQLSTLTTSLQRLTHYKFVSSALQVMLLERQMYSLTLLRGCASAVGLSSTFEQARSRAQGYHNHVHNRLPYPKNKLLEDESLLANGFMRDGNKSGAGGNHARLGKSRPPSRPTILSRSHV